jgi:hypothetical protein
MKINFFFSVVIFLNCFYSCKNIGENSSMIADGIAYYEKYNDEAIEKYEKEHPNMKTMEIIEKFAEQVDEEKALNSKYPSQKALSIDSLKMAYTFKPIIEDYKLFIQSAGVSRDNFSGFKEEDFSNLYFGRYSFRDGSYKNISFEYVKSESDFITIKLDDVGHNPAWRIAADFEMVKSDKIDHPKLV